MIDPVVEKVRAFLARHRMAVSGQRMLVAVSGGADSMALLHLLCDLAHAVEVVHFDHRTRNGESARDAEFVRNTAALLGVPFHVELLADGIDPEEPSFEVRARNARYSFFQKVAHETGISILATGHHRDDQAETVLMRIVRGTAGRGLAGIPPVRVEGSLQIIRPLLDCTHTELREWLVAHGVPWREDATNADPDHARRNRVRLELLPLLAREYNPRVAEALAQLAETQQEENALIEAWLDETCAQIGLPLLHRKESAPDKISLRALRALPGPLRRRWWVRLLESVGTQADHERVKALDALFVSDHAGMKLDFGNGPVLYRGRDDLRIITEETLLQSESIPLSSPGQTTAMGCLFTITRHAIDTMPAGGPKSWCTPWRQVFDIEAVRGTLLVRSRMPGDRFRPLGMGGEKKLQDYFVDRGVPEPLRDQVPLVVAENGILWVVGHAPSVLAAVTDNTRQLLEIEVCDANE